jgi:hypothetical protein
VELERENEHFRHAIKLQRIFNEIQIEVHGDAATQPRTYFITARPDETDWSALYLTT